MTEPVRVGEVLPEVVAEAIARAGPAMTGGPSWSPRPATAPIRSGWAAGSSTPTGERRSPHRLRHGAGAGRDAAEGVRQPPGVACPSCSATYQADAYQLLAAGLRGGKGVPETVSRPSPAVRDLHRPILRPGPSRKAQGAWCCPAIPTGKAPAAPMACGRAAGSAMTRTIPGWASRSAAAATTARPKCCGTPGRSAVATNHHLPVARSPGWSAYEAELRAGPISYAKVAEYHERGAVHFHAVMRLDAATECRCPGCVAPPPEPFTAELLEDALRLAAASVAVPWPMATSRQRFARWGSSSTCATSPRPRTRPGAVGRAGGWVYRQVRHQGHRGLRRQPGPAAPVTSTWKDLDQLPAMWSSSSGPAGSWAAALSWTACGCGSGRTCSASAATSRPRAAATPPPRRPAAGPAASPCAAEPRMGPCPWTPGSGARGGPGRRRPYHVDLPRPLATHRGGALACAVGRRSGHANTADRLEE